MPFAHIYNVSGPASARAGEEVVIAITLQNTLDDGYLSTLGVYYDGATSVTIYPDTPFMWVTSGA